MTKKAHILLVDDDPHLMRITKLLLYKAGYEVSEATTGEAALRLVRERQPDLILLDVLLPDIDGVEVCRRIKRDPVLVDCFVALLSSLKTSSEHRAEGLEAGADDHIPRPISNRELLARVGALLRIRAAESSRARSHELMLALNRAAHAVQRARTPEAVYRAVGEQVGALGLDATVLTVDEAGTNLAISHLTMASDKMQRAKRLTGLSVDNYRIPLAADSFFNRIVSGKQAVFTHMDADTLALGLPPPVRPIAGRLLRILGSRQAICAPLIINGEIKTLLAITGAGLTESDVPAVTAFANHAAIAIENAQLCRETQRLASFNEELIQSITEGIIVSDAEGTITFVNPAGAEMLGCASEDLMGQHWTEIVPADHYPVVRAANERRAEGRSDRYEIELAWQDSRPIYVLMSGAPRFDAQGHFIGTMAVFSDITERQQMEERLRESENRYRRLVEAMPYGVEEVDLEGRRVFLNDAYHHMLGYQSGELLGTHIWDHEPTPDQTARVRSDFAHLKAAQPVPEPYISQNVRKDGEVIDVLVDWDYVRDDEGVLVGFVSVVTDVTEQRRAEAERQAALAALQESVQKYQALFDQSADGIYLHDLQGNMIDVNQEAVAQSGYSREELLRMDVFDLHEDRSRRDQILGQWHKWSAERPTVIEDYHRHKDSTLFPVDIRTGKVHFGDRELMLAIVRDVSERRQAEEERERLNTRIREQGERMAQVLATVPMGVLLLDGDGRLLQTNPVGERYLDALLDAEKVERVTRLGDRSLVDLLTSPPTRGVWHEVRAGDRIFEVVSRAMGRRTNDESWVLVLREVTRERELEKHRHQQERLAAVGQMAAGIAHDFNNIMAVIVLYAQLGLRTPALPGELGDRLEIIVQQAHQATDLIEQILDFSRRGVLERRPHDLLPLFKEQIRLLERMLPEHIAIELTYDPGEYVVDADPTRMQQMLTNLAVNARDAMPGGGLLRIGLDRVYVGAGTVPVPGMAPGEWIRLTVSDTGTGIAPHVLPHIFEPFFTTKGPGEGSGLGLAQVHGIVGQHGGHITVDSRQDVGSTFMIYLPPLQTDLGDGRRVGPAEAFNEPPIGRGELILVVEDGEAVRKALMTGLVQLNYRTLEAENGEEALGLMADQGTHVALVLSDVVMPAMGGLSLFQELRRMGWQTPVILLTGHATGEELDALRAQGVSACLTKPPDLTRLARTINDALSSS